MDALINKSLSSGSRAHSPKRPSRAEAEAAVKTLISWAGDDPQREGLAETPARVIDSYAELFAGYEQDPEQVLQKTFKQVGGYDDIVVVRDIPFYTHCEHHMVPFFGSIHIAYLPRGGVVGLSKLVRLTNVFARRFQTQENLTAQIIEAINEHLDPLGAAVMIEAEHMCMTMRGVRTPHTKTITHSFRGVFAKDRAEKERVFALITHK